MIDNNSGRSRGRERGFMCKREGREGKGRNEGGTRSTTCPVLNVHLMCPYVVVVVVSILISNE